MRRTAAIKGCAVVAALAVFAGCPRAGDRAGSDRTVVSVAIDGEPDDPAPGAPASDGDEPAPLEDPRPPDPEQPHLSYLRQVHAPLGAAWRTFLEDCRTRLRQDHPLNDRGLEVTLAIDLDRRGRVRRVAVAHASGRPELDRAAVDIVRDLRAFAPPPADALSDDGQVHLRWLFARDRRQAGVATATLIREEWPPERAVPRLVADGRFGDAAGRVARAAATLTADRTVERSALVALFDQIAVAVLRRALAGQSAELQRAAIALAAAGRMTFLAPTLRQIARDGVDLGLRGDAMRALGVIGDAGAQPILLAALSAERVGATDEIAAAAGALVALGEQAEVARVAIDWLRSGAAAQRAGALAILRQVAVAGAVADLTRMLAAGSRDDKLEAAAALGVAVPPRGDTRPMRALLAGLAEQDGAVRAACAHAIAAAAQRGVRGRGAARAVVPLIGDRDERVRAGAVLAAARLEPTRFARELPRLRREESPLVLASLADGLALVRGKEARARLDQLARADDPAVRRRAAASLAAIADEPSAALLARLAAADPDREVRRTAIGSIRDIETLTALADAAQWPDTPPLALARLVRLRGKSAMVGDVARRMEAANAPDIVLAIAGGWWAE